MTDTDTLLTPTCLTAAGIPTATAAVPDVSHPAGTSPDLPLRIVLSDHARTRMAQRGISPLAVKLAITRGVCIRKQGLVFRVLRGKDIPPSISPHTRGRIKNTVVVTKTDTDTGTCLVLTTYRNDKALKHIRLKPDGLL
ncbi:protein of unknown function (DUF4258) [Cyclonatronum proteinivorum]|uniref:DUF4258 domain-containing protein n=1 Tax=Cyclonatronum proteinivorum TaxID=1457365 RepID=A0A345UPM9_9BACT|nr:DUF4258 domain-containing protein [Cyclonatronum proteinivorum]AXJ02431.1 protein of unknown function (DUF4258) [Cyclonatronum proteinivorum]